MAIIWQNRIFTTHFSAVFGMALSGAEPGRPTTKKNQEEEDKYLRPKAKPKAATKPDGWEGATSSTHRDGGDDTAWLIAQRRKRKKDKK